ncbi:unnamed protein product, partial [Sphenostylis stenocarpa]
MEDFGLSLIIFYGANVKFVLRKAYSTSDYMYMIPNFNGEDFTIVYEYLFKDINILMSCSQFEWN